MNNTTHKLRITCKILLTITAVAVLSVSSLSFSMYYVPSEDIGNAIVINDIDKVKDLVKEKNFEINKGIKDGAHKGRIPLLLLARREIQ